MKYARFDDLLVEGPEYQPRYRQVTICWNDARRLKVAPLGYGAGSTTRVLILKVRFSRDGDLTFASLEGAERLTARQLQRFPWTKWLSVALATYELRAYPGPDVVFAAMTPKRELKRPGRKGHSKGFYVGVAAKHQKLTKAGVRNPAVEIAKDFDDALGTPCSTDTVRTWIKKCRALKLLPPASKRSTQ